MKKCIVFLIVMILLLPVVCRAEEYKKNLAFGNVIISVSYKTNKIVYDGQLKYDFSGVDRVGAYRMDMDGYMWYGTGAYSSASGSVLLTHDIDCSYDGEDVTPSYAPAFNNKSFNIENVTYLDTGYISEYRTNNASVGISGCPVFNSFEALEKYLNEGIYDDSDIISFEGIDKDGNPLENDYKDKIDNDIPLPQNFHWYDSSITTGNGSNPVFDSYFTWDNVKDVKSGDFYAEIQIKAKFSYKGYFGRTLKNGGTTQFSSDWVTLSPATLDTMEKILYFTDNNSLSPKSNVYEFQLADDVAKKYGMHKRLDSEINVGISNTIYDTYVMHEMQYRIRNFYYSGNIKKCSNWILKNVENRTSLTNNSDGDNDATITDNEGNPVDDYDYEQDSADDSSSSSSSSSSNFFDWLANQVNGLNRFFASIKKSFTSATDAGTSFIAMFKSYNSWLPESFFTMLVTGIGIIILLRILGR